MDKEYKSFDNLELSARKSSVIQERVNLVVSHMYKQFLEYQNSYINTQEAFAKIIDNIIDTVDHLKQSFTARGIPAQNIGYEIDSSRSVVVLNILWHTISFTYKYNIKPQALEIENKQNKQMSYLITGRIIAMNGNYFDIIKKNSESEFQSILEAEVLSLYIQAEKDNPAIMKVKHSGRELFLNNVDAPKEFVLKVIETICGGGVCHEQYSIKSISF